jgi:hypothetical protein
MGMPHALGDRVVLVLVDVLVDVDVGVLDLVNRCRARVRARESD